MRAIAQSLGPRTQAGEDEIKYLVQLVAGTNYC